MAGFFRPVAILVMTLGRCVRELKVLRPIRETVHNTCDDDDDDDRCSKRLLRAKRHQSDIVTRQQHSKILITLTKEINYVGNQTHTQHKWLSVAIIWVVHWRTDNVHINKYTCFKFLA